MKVQILSDNLKQAVAAVLRLVSERSSLPVLSNLKLETDGDGRLAVAATNLDAGMVVWTGCKVYEPGGVTIPARLLSDLLHSFPPDELLDLALSARTVTLVFTGDKAGKHQLKGIDVAEFPLIPSQLDGGAALDIPASEFVEAVSRVAYAASSDQSRPILSGIFLNSDGQVAELVTADGFRLARVKLSAAPSVPVRATMPVKAVVEFASKLAARDPGVLHLVVSDSKAILRAEAGFVVSQLIEGEYPQYQTIVGSTDKPAGTFECQVDDFLQAARIVDHIAEHAGHTIRLLLDQGKGLGKLVAVAAEYGDSENAFGFSGKGELPKEIGLNGRYLGEALMACPSETVQVSLSTPTLPIRLSSVGMPQDWLNIIMPMYLSSTANK